MPEGVQKIRCKNFTPYYFILIFCISFRYNLCIVKRTIEIFNYQIVKNAADQKAEIFIDGDIVDATTQEFLKEWWGDSTSVSYNSFRNQLLNSEYKTVDVYVNSYGGHVGDAMAMHDLIVDLNNKGWNINTYGRGMVCSSATYIVMAGKNKGSVSANTSWLIHNVSGGMYGNVTEMENYVAMMRKFNNMVVDFYASRSGMSKEKIADLMNKETWMIGQEIVDNGFVSEVTGAVDFKNAIPAERWPYSNRAILNSYNSKIQNSNNMDIKKLIEDMRNEFRALFANKENNSENIADAVADSVSKVLNEVNNANTTAVNEAVTAAVNAAMSGETFTNAVNAAVNTAKEGIMTDVKNHVAESLKNVVDEKKFNELMNSLTEKLGTFNAGKKGGEQPKLENNHAGVTIEI